MIRMFLVLSVVALLGCDATPPEPIGKAKRPWFSGDIEAFRPTPPATEVKKKRRRRAEFQDVVYFRFVERLASAKITGPIGIAKTGALGSKRQFVNPHSKLARHLRWRNIRYGIWDTRHGRIDMRNSIRLAVPSRMTHKVDVLPRSRMTMSLLVPGRRRTRKVRVVVKVGTTIVFDKSYFPAMLPPDRNWIQEEFVLRGVKAGQHDVQVRTVWSDGAIRPQGELAEVLLADLRLLTRVSTTDTKHLKRVEKLIGNFEPMNVIVVVVDALRAGVLDPKKRPYPSISPNFDALIKHGTAFHDAYGNSNQTRSSTTIMLSGRYLTSMGLTTPWWILNPRIKKNFYKQKPPLLPLLLHKHGFVTQAISNNQFIFGNLYLGLDMGFDNATDYRQRVMDTVNITKRASAWIRRNRHKRFFLFVNYNSPHTPYVPPEKYRRQVDRATAGLKFLENRKYLGEITYADDYFGRLVRLLKKLRIRKRTLIVLTADHGEVMNGKHHGCRSVRFYAPCHFSHGLTFYDEELHIPLVFSMPGTVPGKREVRMPVSHVDMAPTIMDLLGLPISPAFDGKSLKGYINGKNEPSPRFIFSEGRTGWSIRWKGFKYIHHNWASDFTTPAMRSSNSKFMKSELYDLKADPREEQNLVVRLPKKAQKYKRLLFTFAAGLRQKGPRLDPIKVVKPNKKSAPKPTSREVTPAPKLPPVTHYLVFNGGQGNNRFTGRVSSSGKIELIPLKDPKLAANCRVAGSETNELICDVTLQKSWRYVRFKTVPAQSEIRFGLTRNGKPVSNRDIFIGANGIALLDKRLNIKSPALMRVSVAGHRGPRFVKGDDPGLFYWTSGYTDPKTLRQVEIPRDYMDDSLDRNMPEEARKLLKDMGYVK